MTTSLDASVEDVRWPYGLELPKGFRSLVGTTWVQIEPLGRTKAVPRQGWKLHISARPQTCAAMLRLAVPHLIACNTTFKVARSADLLRRLNSGALGEPTIGKFVTIYPEQDAVRDLGVQLAALLVGFEGPRIASDRQVRRDAPVYYRYGAFEPRFRLDSSGAWDVKIFGPSGETMSGLAQGHHVTVPWASDPFVRGSQGGSASQNIVLGDTFQIESVIGRSQRGATYRARDLRTGVPVIVKQARAFVNETATGDSRSYLRSEARALRLLVSVHRVPRVVDFLRAGQDVFLVLSALDGSDLRFDVLENGLYQANADRRSLRDLTAKLLHLIDRVHAAGVIIRDLAPKNVMVLKDGEIGLIDFETSRVDGRQLFGWSPGYSAPGQQLNGDATVEDDLYSLGATLFYATTGIAPFIRADGSTDLPATLRCLAEVTGDDEAAMWLVSGLMSDRARDRRRVAEAIRVGTWGRAVRPLLPRTAARLEDDCLKRSQSMAARAAEDLITRLRSPDDTPPDLSLYSGVAGLVQEIDHHPELRDLVEPLASAAVGSAEGYPVSPGLFFGRSGIALAWLDLSRGAMSPAFRERGVALLPGAADLDNMSELDVARGVAGVGITALAFEDEGAELAAACASRFQDFDATWADLSAKLPVNQPGHAISIPAGLAHGIAGVAYFCMLRESRTTTTKSKPSAGLWDVTKKLAATGMHLAGEARTPRARPMAASWCQGLAGIGVFLAQASSFHQSEYLLSAAEACAQACFAIAPRSASLSQCCGLAGIGELAVDLASVTGKSDYLREAHRVMQFILERGGLAPPLPSGNYPQGLPVGWGTGVAGTLAFARRLSFPNSPKAWFFR